MLCTSEVMAVYALASRRLALARGLLLGVLLVAATADGSSAQAASDTTFVRVTTPRFPGVATLVAEVRIGDESQTRDHQFDRVKLVMPTTSGTVWVIDDSRGREVTFSTTGGIPTPGADVRVFTAGGAFVRRVGRRGQGPGEWEAPSATFELADGRVLLTDGSLANRFTFFARNGDLDTVWTFERRHFNVAADRDGFFRVTEARVPGPSADAAASRALTYTRSLLGRDGRLLGDLPPLPPPPVQDSVVRSTTRSGHIVSVHARSYAFDIHPLRAATAGTPAVWLPGDPVLSVRRQVPEVAIPEAERRDRRAYLEARARYMGTPAGTRIAEVPRVKLPLKRVIIDLDQRLWVEVSTPSERYDAPRAEVPRGRPAPPVLNWREPQEFDVFEIDGTLVGRVRVPWGVTILTTGIAARGDRVWGIETTAQGTEVVVGYRIVWQ